MRIKKLKNNNFYFYSNKVLQSIYPPYISFGYSYFSNLIPPFSPTSCLIIGYGEGTVAHLIKKIWGDINIIGIDIEKSNIFTEDKIIISDAQIEIKNIKEKFDYVIVDIWQDKGIPDFVFNEEFVKDLARITKKLLSINYLDMLEDIETRAKKMEHYKNYFDFDFLKDLLHNHIYFFKAKDNKESYFL